MRPGLLEHRKFRRLSRAIGGTALALGSLELLWSSCYQSGDDRLGDADDLEAIADWQGERGALATALADCGFVDLDPEGGFRVHDLHDHAPEYVQRRAGYEAERRKVKRCEQCGGEYRSREKRSRYCADACRAAAHRATHANARVTHAAVTATNSNAPPAPAPAPAPAPLKSVDHDRGATKATATEAPAPFALAAPAPPVDPVGTQARAVLEALNAARKAAIPNARALRPTPDNLALISARLRAGATVADCLHVIAVRRREVELGGDPQWFDAVTPFRPEPFARATAIRVEDVRGRQPARGAHTPTAAKVYVEGEQ